MKKAVSPKNYLTDNFYAMPLYANTTMTSKELKETLLYTEGNIMACGELWDIKSKSLGAGVYKIWLKKWKPDWKE